MSTSDNQQNSADVSALTDNLNDLNMDRDNGPPKTEEEYAQSQLTLRAIVSSKEAGVIIGKAGKNVADLREETGVKAGVSKVVQGVHDRVLTVTGPLDGISKAYSIVAKGLLEGAPAMGMGGAVSANGTHRRLTRDARNQNANSEQRSVCSSHTIKWEPLLVVRVSRSR
jgi:heterogeneous nuclear rnp K-like protein 2